MEDEAIMEDMIDQMHLRVDLEIVKFKCFRKHFLFYCFTILTFEMAGLCAAAIVVQSSRFHVDRLVFVANQNYPHILFHQNTFIFHHSHPFLLHQLISIINFI